MNRLANEKSPYLLQHKENPVDWFPWCKEAFEKAEREDKPVFLSIGYATCHWCHVMERESFTDPEIAEILNKSFIAIKVDREERPDIDDIYMQAIHAMGQQGGWPLNIFLTPQKKPVTGGTYFPPRDYYNRPSFRRVLEKIADLWQNQRDKIHSSAENLTRFLLENSTKDETEPQSPALSPLENYSSIVNSVVGTMVQKFDPTYGGFLNNGPNKFPPSLHLLYLIKIYRRTNNPQLLEITEKTLNAITHGGIYDQVGGGISRYSTDHQWLVPHFEKMLYDNALFALSLVETYQITGNEKYKQVFSEIFNYLERDLSTPECCFASAEDADSEGVEGKFYLWDHKEFYSTLLAARRNPPFTGEMVDKLARTFRISPEGNFESRTILRFDPDAAKEIDNRSIDQAREALRVYRDKRPRPLKDDKLITSWNSLGAISLCAASLATGSGDFAEKGITILAFIRSRLYKDNTLARSWREGVTTSQGQLSDYALFAIGAILAYRVTGDTQWLELSQALANNILSHFSGNGGAFFDPPANDDLLVRIGSPWDGVEPSGNSAAAMLFLILSMYHFTGKSNDWRHHYENIITKFTDELLSQPTSLPWMCSAMEIDNSQTFSFALFEGENREEFDQIKNYIDTKLPWYTAFAWELLSGSKQKRKVPLLENRTPVDGKTTLYLCTADHCLAPIFTLGELKKTLQQFGQNLYLD